MTDVTPGAPPAGGCTSTFPVPPQELQRPVPLHCLHPEMDMTTPLIDGSKLEAFAEGLQGVLTAAEQHLAKSLAAEKGRDHLKQVRTQLIETPRPVMEALIEEATGVKVVGLDHDISTARGEEISVLTLGRKRRCFERRRRSDVLLRLPGHTATLTNRRSKRHPRFLPAAALNSVRRRFAPIPTRPSGEQAHRILP